MPYKSTMRYGKAQRKLRAARSKVSALTTKRVGGVKYKSKRKVLPKITKMIRTAVGQMSSSVVSKSHKPSRQVSEMKAVADSNVYVFTDSRLITQDPGYQVSEFFSANTQAELVLIGSQLSQNNKGTRRYVLESVLNEYTFTNNSTGSVEFELIDLVLKRDLENRFEYMANGIAYGPITGNPKSMWDWGSQVDSGGSSTLPAHPLSEIVGAKPFDTALFNEYFRPMKRTFVMLAQGASHRHVLNLKPNRLVDEAMYNHNTDASNNVYQFIQGFKGLSVYTLIIAKGLPVVASGITGSATTGIVSLSCVKATRTKYAWVQDNSKSIAVYDNLLTDITPKIVNVGSGGIDTEAAAT